MKTFRITTPGTSIPEVLGVTDIEDGEYLARSGDYIVGAIAPSAAVSGTGFTHVTAGVQDAAAKTVDTDDITGSAVTYAKIQSTAAADRLIGRGNGLGAGAVEEVSLGTSLGMTGTVLNMTGTLGTVVTVNTDPATGGAEFNDTTPAAPAGYQNVLWQRSLGPPANVSAHVPLIKPSMYLTPFGLERLMTMAASAQSERGVVTNFCLPTGAKFRYMTYRVGTVQAASPDSCVAIYSYNGDVRHFYADSLDLAPAAGGTGQKVYDFGSVTTLAPGNYLFLCGNKDATMQLFRASATGINVFTRSSSNYTMADGSVSPATLTIGSLGQNNVGNMPMLVLYDTADE